MSTDPISIDLLVNTDTVKKQFSEVITGAEKTDQSFTEMGENVAKQSENLAKAADKARQRFAQFYAEMERNNATLGEGARLTEAATQAINRHKTIIEGLKGQIAEALDPTSIGVYQYQIKQANDSINKIIEAANTKVSPLDTAKIEEANKKIEEATVLMDKIADTSLNMNFGNPQELEVLSAELNKTDNAFQQLGAVVDFVQAKMHTIEMPAEEFAELQKDIMRAKEMLGLMPEAFNTTGYSINQLQDSLAFFKKELEQSQDPEFIKKINENIQVTEERINQLKNIGKKGFDELGNKIKETTDASRTVGEEFRQTVAEMARLQTEGKENTAEYEALKNKALELKSALHKVNSEMNDSTKAAKTVAQELRQTTAAMAQMRAEGKQNTAEYEALKSKALELKTSLAMVNGELNQEIKGTTRFDALLKSMTGITAGYTMIVGAMGAFNTENEEAQKTIQKVTSAMAILQALQQLTVQLKTADTTVTSKQTAVQAIYTTVVGASTGAARAFRIALASTGIGLIIILLGSLVANWDKVTASIKRSFPALKDFGKTVDEIKAQVMGFLNAYLSLYKTVYDTLKKLFELDLKGAVAEAKKMAENAKKAFKEGAENEKNKQEADNANQALDAVIKADEKKLELLKKSGKASDAFERNLFNKKLERYKNDAEKYEEILHEKALFEAGILKEQNDNAKRLADQRQADADKAAKKAKDQAIKAQEELNKVLEKIREKEENFNNKETEGDQIAKIKKEYASLKAEALRKGAGRSDINRIDILAAKEETRARYQQETQDLFASLEEQRQMFAAYEAFKTRVGKEEADLRYSEQLKGHENYTAILDAEIAKLKSIQDPNFDQKERLKGLEEKKTEDTKENQQAEEKKFADAYASLITFDEKRRMIEAKYQKDKAELEKMQNPEIRQAKLEELEYQKSATLEAVNEEAYERKHAMENLSQNLLGITKRELKNRIASLEEYLEKNKGLLSEEQEAHLRSELKKAQSVQATTELGIREKVLLEQKTALMKKIEDAGGKSKANVQDEVAELENVNNELNSILRKKIGKMGAVAGELSGAFTQLGGALKEYDEGLGDTVETMGELMGAFADIAGGIASGDPVSIIKGVISGVTKLLSIGAKARESERKAMEELKKYHDSVFQSQLDYNAELRKRVVEETKINDLYKDRVTNIREEIAANKKNVDNILKDQQTIFDRLLKTQTVVGMTTKKYGGFLGFGRKTKAVEQTTTVAEQLGIGSYREGFLGMKIFEPGQAKITDEIFRNLEELNAKKPLTGDAKTAYEQLKKIKDEYGSIEAANRALEKQLTDAITGTTANSLAESIKQGLASGKKSFADFADDIEGFLRNAVLAGLETEVFAEKTQKLQDALKEMMDDGVITTEEREEFNKLYMAIVEEGKQKMEMLNQAGINVIQQQENANSLQGAIKGMSQESADIMSGHLGGLRLDVKDIYKAIRSQGASAIERLGRMIEVQMNIEKNTKRTAENTEKLHDIDKGIKSVDKSLSSQYQDLKSSGLI